MDQMIFESEPAKKILGGLVNKVIGINGRTEVKEFKFVGNDDTDLATLHICMDINVSHEDLMKMLTKKIFSR